MSRKDISQHHQSDTALIHAYIAGNDESISYLIERYRKKIYNYILLIVKSESTADDIFQDLYIKISSSLKNGKYTDNGKFLSWALRIAHNQVIDFYRQGSSKRTVSTDAGNYAIENDSSLIEPSVEDKMIDEQVKTDIRKLVDALPLEQREVVIMRHYLGMSFKEIATHTDVSINTALGRMRYALINLRKMIEENNLYMELNNFS